MENGLIRGTIRFVNRTVEKRRELRRQRFQAQLETIFKSAGLNPRNVVATKDLEARKAEEPIVRDVKAGDSIVVKTGMDVLIYSFKHVDEEGRLPVLAFSNDRYVGGHLIPQGGKGEVGTGMLTYYDSFSITLRNLAVRHAESGITARIELKTTLGCP